MQLLGIRKAYRVLQVKAGEPKRNARKLCSRMRTLVLQHSRSAKVMARKAARVSKRQKLAPHRRVMLGIVAKMVAASLVPMVVVTAVSIVARATGA